MKKKIGILGLAAMILLSFAGCDNNSGSSKITVQDKINVGGNVNLADEKVSENVSINKAVILKNADFDGHTITVNADATLNNIRNAKIVVAKENISLTCTDSKIESINVGASIARTAEMSRAAAAGYVIIKINASTVATITVNVKNVKITSDEEVTIDLLDVKKEAEDVSISGGKIETLQAIENSNVLNISGGVKIETVKAVTESGESSSKTIYVTITDDETDKPNGVKVLEVNSVVLKTENPKTTYEVNDSFDFTGLSVEVTYSDGSKKTLPLSKENATTTFKSSQEGTINVSFTYKGFPVDGLLSVTIKPTTKKYLQLLNEAVDCFAEMDFDNGIVKIKAAYDETKNDTTKMYYALATLACVSTDTATVDFMRNTCGFETYPNKLNAIITEPWWEACVEEGFVEKVVAANPKGFNDALNKLVKIFENAYDSVLNISTGMEQDSVVIPAKLIEVLNLNEILGSSDVRLGKAQLDMILAYVGIIKGALQYVSAFDWTFDTSSITSDMDIDDFITAVQSGTKLLTVTNASVLEKSKKSFSASVDLIMNSYNYISTSSTYPDEVKEELLAYTILYDAAKALKDALDKGRTFYVPDADIFDLKEWPTSETSDWLVKIDCGKAFSSNVLDDAVEKDSNGKIKFYAQEGVVYVPEKGSTDLLIKVQLPECITIKGIEESNRYTYFPIWPTESEAGDSVYGEDN